MIRLNVFFQLELLAMLRLADADHILAKFENEKIITVPRVIALD
jgi:hypothetical protein